MGFKARPIKFYRRVTSISENEDGSLTFTLECRHLLNRPKPHPAVILPGTVECQACIGEEAKIQALTIELRKTSEHLHQAARRIDHLLTRGT